MIFLAAGGTGGHIFPAIAAVQEIAEKQHIILTDKRFNQYGNRGVKLNIEYLPIQSSSNKIKFFLSLIPSIIKSVKLIKKYKPEKILSFGGYPTIPVLIASILMRKPVVLYEANTIIGRTNKLFYPFAQSLNAGFPLINFKKSYTLTKNPVTKDVVFTQYPEINDTINILIIGGSQAAKIFTDKIPDIIIKFARSISTKVKIIQQCKQEEIESLKELYHSNNHHNNNHNNKITCEINYFFDDLIEKMKNSHLIISRAGALSITEILTIGRPSILIPYPYAKDNHQYFNAKFVEDNNLGILIEQKNLNEENLINSINRIIKNNDFYIKNITRFNNVI